MDLRSVDPESLTISDLNERVENVNTSDLEESIAQHGVIEPPLVRPNGDGHKVIVGQRRTIAARAVGLDEIRVVETDWDDREALTASISENLETLRQDVAKKDRARAIYRLAQMAADDGDEEAFTDGGIPSPTWVANEIGENRNTVGRWIEYLRPEWEGTEVHADYVNDEGDHDGQSINVQEIGESTLSEIRSATGGGDEGAELAWEVQSGDTSQRDVQEVRRQTQRGQSVDEAKQNVEQSKEGRSIQRTVQFNGDAANALITCAEERETSDAQVVRDAVAAYLEQRGYL